MAQEEAIVFNDDGAENSARVLKLSLLRQGGGTWVGEVVYIKREGGRFRTKRFTSPDKDVAQAQMIQWVEDHMPKAELA